LWSSRRGEIRISFLIAIGNTGKKHKKGWGGGGKGQGHSISARGGSQQGKCSKRERLVDKRGGEGKE